MASRRGKSGALDLAPAGRWIFLIGVVVSLLGGLYVSLSTSTDPNVQTWLVYLLIALGLIGGFLHIRKEDEHHFILVAVGVILVSVTVQPFSAIENLGQYLTVMLQFFSVYLGVAVVAVAARNVVEWFTS